MVRVATAEPCIFAVSHGWATPEARGGPCRVRTKGAAIDLRRPRSRRCARG